MNEENINTTFIIVSLITPTLKPLSYSKIRSIFTPEERLNETMNTIYSIRKYSKSSEIVLIELSAINKYNQILKENCDKFIHLGKIKWLQLLINSSFKGLGETISLLITLLMIKNNRNRYFKISGRYELTDEFNQNLHNGKNFIFLNKQKTYSTRLYSWDSSMFYIYILINLIAIPILFSGLSLERILYLFIVSVWATHVASNWPLSEHVST